MSKGLYANINRKVIHSSSSLLFLAPQPSQISPLVVSLFYFMSIFIGVTRQQGSRIEHYIGGVSTVTGTSAVVGVSMTVERVGGTKVGNRVTQGIVYWSRT